MNKKSILLILLLLVATIGFSQNPLAFDYQTIARDSNGEILSDADINIHVSILEDSALGQTIFTESHNLTTTETGLINLNIGEGTAVLGDFSTIEWAAKSHFVKIEIDDTGGGEYFELGTSQLCSVPYSLQSSTLTLTDENGNKYSIKVDTLGNLIAIPLIP